MNLHADPQLSYNNNIKNYILFWRYMYFCALDVLNFEFCGEELLHVDEHGKDQMSVNLSIQANTV